MRKRVIIYGDIHGCLDEFMQLRDNIKPTKEDIEISVGDFLNKGPYSLKTLRYLNEHGIRSIMGNNEAKIIKLYHKYQKKGASYLQELRKSDKKTLLELEADDITYLESLPYYLKINNLTIVHGGIDRGVTLSETMDEVAKKLLTQLRFYNKDLEPIPYDDFENRDKFWSEVYDGREGFVIFGHHPFQAVKIDKHAIGIDTGCVYGRALSAISFDYADTINTEDYTLHAVKAIRKHHG